MGANVSLVTQNGQTGRSMGANEVISTQVPHPERRSGGTLENHRLLPRGQGAIWGQRAAGQGGTVRGSEGLRGVQLPSCLWVEVPFRETRTADRPVYKPAIRARKLIDINVLR